VKLKVMATKLFTPDLGRSGDKMAAGWTLRELRDHMECAAAVIMI